ncbi:MAG TPA: SDR family oxidoreductase [Natronosporangium sp.]|nr:SDR family oxidoreductase [Natronosporangium sp.]
MRVLVTGGTGTAGRELVRRLRDRGTQVRVLSRRPSSQPGHCQGDLDTGQGLAAAVAGVDVIAHCATAADYRRRWRDTQGTRRLLAALGDARPHLVYLSIVGVDRIPFRYYEDKLATERLIETSGLPWTILRTTQFHDLVLLFAMFAVTGPLALAPRGLRAQPVDVGEVADRMAELALGDPAGRVPDLGGPQVLTSADVIRTYLAAAGLRRLPVPVPVPPLGKVLTGFRAGEHLLPVGGVRGTRTFQDYVRSRIRPDGTVAPPYPGRFGR